MPHPYAISEADRAAAHRAGGGPRAGAAARGPLTQASDVGTQLEYATQGSQAGFRDGLSQESVGLGGAAGVNGFHSQGY